MKTELHNEGVLPSAVASAGKYKINLGEIALEDSLILSPLCAIPKYWYDFLDYNPKS
jgi:hypothetical protein